MNRTFKTDIVNLENLDLYNFTIPTYQRPYVWENEQIKKMVDDIHLSFKNSRDSTYYLSTFLTKEDGFSAELIDGQQRFTTLWIIAFVMSTLNSGSDIEKFLIINGELKLGFEIRKEVSEYFKTMIGDNIILKKYDEQVISEYPYLKNIAKAITFVKAYLEQLKLSTEDLKYFGDFIYRNVKLIKNTTPENADLNKLFFTINSAGIQLEQTDIVKANLLKILDDKVLYGKIWEACENMQSFFEKNVFISFPSTNRNEINLNKLVPFNELTFIYKKLGIVEVNHEEFKIDDIDIETIKAENYQNRTNVDDEWQHEESDEIHCRSIINFGQLLLHTYRIHLHIEKRDDFQGTFHVNRIIEIFDEMKKRGDKEEIIRFFLLLWKIRYLFDKYIVKWISDVDTKIEALDIVNISKNDNGYYSRTKYEKSSSLMLQSVMYYTGDYHRQYWLTSYLGYLLKNHSDGSPTDEKMLSKLEEIDNSFSLVNGITDKEISWMHIRGEEINFTFNFKKYLNQNLGTGFKHYWFQKLEYILWKNWNNREDIKFKRYRISSKNSVEHIYPQNPENKIQHPEIRDRYLHSFGNLVLLSVSQNSEYGNKSVNVKKSMFEEKKDTYDTLKSYYIFKDQTEWTIDSITFHRDQMIKLFEKHYLS